MNARVQGLMIVLMSVALVGCQGEDGPAGPEGPVGPAGPGLAINTIDVIPSNPMIEETVTVSVDYVAGTGEEVEIAWSATGGEISGSGAVIQWIAPDSIGDYTIEAVLSSGDLTAVGHITIYVGRDASHEGVIPDIRVATWGSVGVMYTSEEDNLILVRNLLQGLAGANAGLNILYTRDCDPRVDPEYCRLTGDFATLQPFFTMTESIGTIEFADLASVDPSIYDVIIADFCSSTMMSTGIQALRTYLAGGGHALILSQRFCVGTIGAANQVTEELGITFLDLDPAINEPLVIPEQDRVGLLSDVESLRIWRVSPQVISHTFEPVVSTDLGVLCAVVPVSRESRILGTQATVARAVERSSGESRWAVHGSTVMTVRTRYDAFRALER